MIDEDPTIYLDAKGGVPQEERQALTDEQVERLLDTIRDLPPYVFVMIGLYAGLRREEILALPMGFCVSGCRGSVLNGTAGMAHRT